MLKSVSVKNDKEPKFDVFALTNFWLFIDFLNPLLTEVDFIL